MYIHTRQFILKTNSTVKMSERQQTYIMVTHKLRLLFKNCSNVSTSRAENIRDLKFYSDKVASNYHYNKGRKNLYHQLFVQRMSTSKL